MERSRKSPPKNPFSRTSPPKKSARAANANMEMSGWMTELENIQRGDRAIAAERNATRAPMRVTRATARAVEIPLATPLQSEAALRRGTRRGRNEMNAPMPEPQDEMTALMRSMSRVKVAAKKPTPAYKKQASYNPFSAKPKSPKSPNAPSSKKQKQ